MRDIFDSDGTIVPLSFQLNSFRPAESTSESYRVSCPTLLARYWSSDRVFFLFDGTPVKIRGSAECPPLTPG